jgi:hypothetical protein
MATVTRITIERNEERRRIITYRYEVDGREYQTRRRMARRDQRCSRPGDQIRIGFLRSDPQISWVTGYEESGVPLLVVFLVPTAMLAAALALGAGLRRQWVLLSEGRPAEARVTAVKKVSSDKGHAYRVTCEFTTLSGARTTATFQRSGALAVGAVVPVVYHRDRPSWTSTYPMSLVRPAPQS